METGRKRRGTPRTPPPGRRWVKGESGNPGGRPKGFPAHIRAQVGANGEELVAVALEILRNRRARNHDRLDAAVFLRDAGFGKPPQAQTGEGGGPIVLKIVHATGNGTAPGT